MKERKKEKRCENNALEITNECSIERKIERDLRDVYSFSVANECFSMRVLNVLEFCAN